MCEALFTSESKVMNAADIEKHKIIYYSLNNRFINVKY